ncbi:hypothetical protein [Stenotrophomonas maltophilia]|uniref:hypothetical protein n=1 Tax=Stenotrophomonas sp. AS1 TaxID=3029188 RepID=UPI000AEE4506
MDRELPLGRGRDLFCQLSCLLEIGDLMLLHAGLCGHAFLQLLLGEQPATLGRVLSRLLF